MSNPAPAVQLPRLKRLYEDLYTALKPLLPTNHLLLVTLSSPLSPTSSPLRSAIIHLREILVCLRERCAPARDGQIDALIRTIDDLSSIASVPDMSKLVVDTVRSILQLAEAMQDDLSQFVLGTMNEKQLRAVLVTQAQQRQRELVLELWRPQQIEDSWSNWVEDNSFVQDSAADRTSRYAWVHRLMQALGLTVPVACHLPMVPPTSSEPEAPSSNTLPPPLFFVCPTLLHMQNYLQALVIAASLRSLVRMPSASLPSPAAHPETSEVDSESFIARIWALLKAEVNEDPGAGDTKLVNLADEVIRVRRQFNGDGEVVNAKEEATLRAAVDRTLQPHDPVFLLLQKRLLEAIAARLAHPLEASPQPHGLRLPDKLQTGREGLGKRQRLVDMEPIDSMTQPRDSVKEPLLTVKGFEDKVLVKAVGEALVKLRSCVEWTEQVWADVVETRQLRMGTK